MRVALTLACLIATLLYPQGGIGRLRSTRQSPARHGRPRAEPTPVRPSLSGFGNVPRLGPSPAPRTLRPEAHYPTYLLPLLGEPSPRALVVPPGPPVRELLLTFDDGPDLLGTPVVLAELDRRGLKGVFFVNGRHLVGSRPQDFARRDLVRKLAAHGHFVANHTLSHKNVCAEPATLPTEVDGNEEIIAATTGVRPVLFRAPYGARCRSLEESMRTRGLLQVGWNMDPQEWRGGGEDAIVDYVKTMLGRGPGQFILLLHDTHTQAVRALPRILDWLMREQQRPTRAATGPLVIRDYRVFFPERALPAVGLEPVLDGVRGALALLASPWTSPK